MPHQVRKPPRQPFAPTARFDTAALRVDPAGHEGEMTAFTLSAAQAQARIALMRWCMQGFGPSSSTSPFAVATLSGEADSGKAQLAWALSRELDGSNVLAACTTSMARLRLRLRVKLNDCLPWRDPQPADPWDSGYATAKAINDGALARFLPRRATLIVADGLSPEQQALCVAMLQANAQFFRKPVRLLLVNAEGGLALAQQSLALTHLKL